LGGETSNVNRHERAAVSLLDWLLDWLVGLKETLGDKHPGLNLAIRTAAKARELIVLEGDDEPPQRTKEN